jgi:hypothetical protein
VKVIEKVFEPSVAVMVVALARGVAASTSATKPKARVASFKLMLRTINSPF